ncbi:RHS repeat-associated protein [Kitasatospora sp. SolWspMP-SS2h]|uniref:colicin E3/pyocin S6 family cytotoxin n=1 Tax=Kitasatospora sp. SolWspMP-SS2h TaxID=1305729 RepID=UPI000DB9A258|nr:colicin E3/pyocin S6 family cytotoxin [Kitasatospora sp. SolWspMP-SS2h]RAJ29635.1 RHS repeat-associated protein [Kitasatospora sp. SolWspMP-SS2h]
MSNQIVKALEHGAQKLGKTLAEDAGKALKSFYRKAGDNLAKVARNTREVEARHVKDLEKILKGEGGGGLPHPRAGGGRGGSRNLPGRGRPGQSSEGNTRCLTAGDPVDVVSGQMILSETDLELPGVLPLVLRRSYASGYQGGQYLGAGWCSSVDQRVQVDADGIHFAGDDAQVLHYPRPDDTARPVLPADGARWPLSWDRDTDTIRIEDTDTGWTRHFAAAGTSAVRPLSALTDRNGNRVDHLHDEAGLPTEIRHSGGYRVAVDTLHTAAGPRIEALRLLDGSNRGLGTTVVGYGYDARGRLAEIRNSSGVPLVYAYDAQDRITSWTDRNGFWYAYEYGPDGRVRRGHGSEGALEAAFAYDDGNRVTSVTDGLGRRTEYHYDRSNHVLRTVDPGGHAVHTEYDRFGRVLSTTDQLGRSTRYDLDANGRPIRITYPDGVATEAAYDAHGLPVRVTTVDGAVWHYAYDDRGNCVAITDPCGATTRYAYDGTGRPTGIVDAAGQAVTIANDGAGLTTALTDPLGHTTRLTRDAFGRVVTETDQSGRTTQFGWTVEGWPSWRQLPDGSREERSYDPEGNLLEQVDPHGGRTGYDRGAFGVPTARRDAAGNRTEFRYDSELRLTAVTGPDGRSWRYSYDAAGNLASETDFNGRTVHYEHDAAGQLTRRTNGAGQRVDFTWDAAGRVVRQTTDAGTRVDFRYDAAGNLTGARNDSVRLEFTHDALGRVLTESANGLTLSNRYDPLGRRVERRTPSGSVTAWQHDANHRTAVLEASGLRLAFGYDPAGRELHRWIGDRTALVSDWDARGRLTAQQLVAVDGGRPAPASRLLNGRSWTYRADGVPTSQSDSTDGTRHFDLDPLGQVTASRTSGWTEAYAYDPVGNPLHAELPAGAPADAAGARTVDGMLLRRAGRLRYEYDAQGRLTHRHLRTLSGQEKTWRFGYDAYDRMTSAVTPSGEHWRYLYDPLGRRTVKQLAAPDGAVLAETRFCWDDEQLAEQGHHVTGRSAATVTTWEYEPHTWRPVAQVQRTRTAAGVVDERCHAVVTDLAGAPTELVAPNGDVEWRRTATLWGLPVTTSSTGSTGCPLRFPGQYQDDETGLHYNRHRYYDPETARFTTPDPLGLSPAPHHYAYVTNPLDEIDPLGLAKKKRSGGGGNSGNNQPSTPAPGSRAIPARVPPPRGGLPGFPGANRVSPKTPVQGGGGLRPRWEDGRHIYEWDSQHGEIEKYNKQGKHLGAYDPVSGQQLKGPDPGRKCVK